MQAGTNFVFSAMRGYDFIIDPITYPSNSQNLDTCLQTMLRGFREVMEKLDEDTCGYKFRFPGPADYRRGIIGGFLPNFRRSRRCSARTVPQQRTETAVFINNDGDLFALGEAKGGILPEIDRRVKELGGTQTYTNLFRLHFWHGLRHRFGDKRTDKPW